MQYRDDDYGDHINCGIVLSGLTILFFIWAMVAGKFEDSWLLWILFLFFGVVSVLSYIAIYTESKLPPFPDETDELKQNLESWLFSEGYHRFFGEVVYTNQVGVVSFKLNNVLWQTFAQPKDEKTFAPYSYADVGNYRIVKFYGRHPQYYVKSTSSKK